MKTYWVKVAVPLYYHIDANTKGEASRMAVAQFTSEHQSGEIPQVLAVEELDYDGVLAEEICQGKSCIDELKYLGR
jgi:hypothetical protein